MRVGFLGPAGTFTEEALRASSPAGVEEIPFATVFEAVMAVQNGDVDHAVVPIENSLEGAVTATLDALAGEASDVRIAAEVVRPIRHCLIARRSLSLGDVTRVVSHPQATAQCARFLRQRLAAAERKAVESTAEAVRVVAESDEPWAALGGRLAADLYGCRVLEEGVENDPENRTRFVWLARVGSDREQVAGSGRPDRAWAGSPVSSTGATRSKTSIVFWGLGEDAPGALVEVLRELSDREINLTKIESRPRQARLGRYMFFVDLEGGLGDDVVAEALAALRGRVETLRVLGSYPSI